MSKETITRRHLPHWFVPDAYHFVTYRLAGTVPRSVLDEMIARREAALRGPAAARERVHKLFFAEFDQYLDHHRDIHWLDDPRVAAAVRENLYFHRDKKYELLSYCIMPNHVHVLLKPLPATPTDQGLADVMHSLKSYTANRANQILGLSAPFWQDESYDHWVRDGDELERIIEYISMNPVKAKLVSQPHQWFFCSAHDRFLQDGSYDGWLLP